MSNYTGAPRRHRRGRMRLAVPLLAVSALSMAACGGDDSDSSSPAATTAANTGTSAATASSTGGSGAATGTPIKIGQIAAGDVVYQAKSSTAPDVLKMWAEEVNAKGGINGHPVEVVTRDDKGDPATGLSVAKDLIENEKVVALVGNSAATTEPAWADLATKNNVPVIGGVAYGSYHMTSPNFYAVGPVITAAIYGAMAVPAQKAGAKKIGVLLCNEAAICDGAVPLYQGFAKALGVDVSTIIKAAVTQANYTSECVSLKQAGVDTILVAGPPLLKVANDCKRQGLEVKMATNDMTGVSPDVAKDFNVYTETTGFPVFQEFPETKPFFDALRKHHPEYLAGGDKYESFVTGGTGGSIGPLAWSAAEAFKKAVENANVAAGTQVTRADVTKGLSMFKGETLGGIAPPLTFGDGTAPNPPGKCYFVAGSENGKYIAPDGLKPSCQP